jgi:hypothetical protein
MTKEKIKYYRLTKEGKDILKEYLGINKNNIDGWINNTQQMINKRLGL